MVLHVGGPVGDLAEVDVHDDGCHGLADRDNHIHVVVRIEDLAFVSQHGQRWHVKQTTVVVRANYSRSVQEADDDPAAENPTWEADAERLQVLDQSLLGWEVRVWQISDWVDAHFSFELLAQVLCIVLNHVVVPQDIQAAAMPTPTNQENCAP